MSCEENKYNCVNLVTSSYKKLLLARFITDKKAKTSSIFITVTVSVKSFAWKTVAEKCGATAFGNENWDKKVWWKSVVKKWACVNDALHLVLNLFWYSCERSCSLIISEQETEME